MSKAPESTVAHLLLGTGVTLKLKGTKKPTPLTFSDESRGEAALRNSWPFSSSRAWEINRSMQTLAST